MKTLQTTALVSFLAAASYASAHTSTAEKTETNNTKTEVLFDERKNKKLQSDFNTDRAVTNTNES